MTEILDGPDALVAGIRDGAHLAVVRDTAGAPMAAVRALVRRRVKDLHLVAVPESDLVADMLIGAGCVALYEGSGVSMSEHGPARNFARAVKEGRIALRDSTCPAVYAACQAGEKRIPFIPFRGLIGSDLLEHRDDWMVVDNPFAPGDRIVLLPAIVPEVALFHVPLADREGNVWVGLNQECAVLAHAAERTLVTAERIQDDSLLADEARAPGVVPSLYVDALAPAERGAWPKGLEGHYPDDAEHLRAYVEASRTEEGLRDYLARYVLGEQVAAE